MISSEAAGVWLGIRFFMFFLSTLVSWNFVIYFMTKQIKHGENMRTYFCRWFIAQLYNFIANEQQQNCKHFDLSWFRWDFILTWNIRGKVRYEQLYKFTHMHTRNSLYTRSEGSRIGSRIISYVYLHLKSIILKKNKYVMENAKMENLQVRGRPLLRHLKGEFSAGNIWQVID